MIDSCHIYNGLSGEGLVDEDGDDTGPYGDMTIIYQPNIKGADPGNASSHYKETGGNSISNCYLGKGKVVLEYPCFVHMTGNRFLYNPNDNEYAIQLVAKPVPTGPSSYLNGPFEFPKKLTISGTSYQQRIYDGKVDFIKLKNGGDSWTSSAHNVVDNINAQDTWAQTAIGASLYKETLVYSEANDTFVVKNPSYEYRFQSSGFKPASAQDGTLDLGDGNQRWKRVFAVEGTIQTSDERLKNSIVDLSQAESNVAKAIRKLVKRFKFNGEDKYSIGVIAQQVIAAFESEGLDPFEYSIISNEGEYYGVNYSQLLCFIIGGLD